MDRKSGSASQHMANLRATPAVPRPRSTLPTDSVQIERNTSPGPPLPPKTPENLPSRLRPLATIPSLSHNAPPPTRFISHALPPLTISDKLTVAPPLRQPAVAQPSIQKPAGQVWEDLISLQGPSQSSSLPLQYSPVSPFPSQPQVPVQQQPTMLGNPSNPFMHLSLGQANATASLAASPISVSTPGPQFPFAPSAPLPSPALHLGATNPFNQSPFAASMNGTAFSTSSNPFSPSPMSVSVATSTPTTLSVQPVIALPIGGLLHTPPIPYVRSQTSTPAPSFPPTPFGPTGPAPNPFAPVNTPGQMPLSASGATNPFSAMQMGQVGFSGVTQTTFGTTAFLNQQQQQQLLGPNGFGGWAGQGAQGAF